VSEKFVCKLVDGNGHGLIVYSVVQVVTGGKPGMVTDGSEIC